MKNSSFLPADVLLPKGDFEKWAVVACDQYTSEPQYWKQVEETVKDEPSAYRIILPEAYLSADNESRIKQINSTMETYLETSVLREVKNKFIYVEREVTGGKIRKGIVGVIDLEEYDYHKGSKAIIRATEETVIERIPPRVKIRRDAPLEIPHIMLLLDDPQRAVIEPLTEKKEGFLKLYDFSLMQKSGRIKGYAVDDDTAQKVQLTLEKIKNSSEDKMLFAVGDGNHSLACAKECYLEKRNEKSRYALVEVVNIHDESIEFEPIYRVVFGAEPEKLINAFKNETGEYFGEGAQKFTCIYGKNKQELSLKPSSALSVGTLQNFLDRYIKENPGVSVDYIHGEDVVRKLAGEENTTGFLF
ncbi:MAG: DUF1015 domain-containing protein, partial [Clostridia bacterium]|nr:DUF1015 domain-containing protein [Clostridia bacterium]